LRKLASIKEVKNILPIEKRDRIELAIIDGWQVIVKKDEFKIGDKVIYVEIDSILPEKEEFEFLRSKKFRIKTMKMAGVLSQGICFPLSYLPKHESKYELDQDVTEELGVKKYEADQSVQRAPKERTPKNPILKFFYKFKIFRKLFSKTKYGNLRFPEFISKTDETRIQNIPHILTNKEKFKITEKIDGQSATFYIQRIKSKIPFIKDKFYFGVCSRNYELPYNKDSIYWQMAEKYKIKEFLIDMMNMSYREKGYLAIQGEQAGPGIQGNKYKLDEHKLFVFNFITPNFKLDPNDGDINMILLTRGFDIVPDLGELVLPDTVNELLNIAKGKSVLNKETLREGIVIRSYHQNISFKAISPDFEIKYD
jgi:hypothetical protein